MTDYTSFRLPSGAVVRVQSSLHPPPLLADEAGVEQASGLQDKARGGC
jgi:hypothetical protein